MDQRRMDAEGGRVIYRGKRARKLAVVVAVQNLLVVACLLATLCVYLEQSWLPEDIVHIEFGSIATVSENKTLKFPLITSSNSMHLTKDNKTIIINCTAPYIWYIDVCYDSSLTGRSSGTLLLQVEGNETPVESIKLNTTSGVCRGLSSTVYLRARELASVRLLTNENHFMITNVTMGLSSLLGKRCEY